jgi:hypothetical protein
VTGRRFTGLLLGVSALAALAVTLLVDGLRGGLVALVGVAALARILVVTEQARRGR